ncbi:MAG: hypothetical protein AAGE76_09325 [Pseudomonadota bacterium]
MPRTTSTAYEDPLQTAISALRDARQLLSAEISAYPTPISGCDAQFNRMLGDRTRISSALAALEATPFVPTPRALVPGASLESR